MAHNPHRNFPAERRPNQADKHATIAMLAAHLSHQLGSPLNVIRGRAEHLLRAQENSAKTTAALKTIIGQVDRIAGNLRSLLELCTRDEPVRALCDLREIVCSAAALARTRAEARRVNFSMKMIETPCLVRCDADQLQQLFLNLIGNAIDAMAPKGGRLKIFAQPADSAEQRVRIVVEDSGCPIPPELIPRVFDPFFACASPRAIDGMSLAVAQSIAREHDGELGFELVENCARFVLTLPIVSSVAARDLQ